MAAAKLYQCNFPLLSIPLPPPHFPSPHLPTSPPPHLPTSHSSAGKGLTGLRKLRVLRLDHNHLEQVAPGEVVSLASLVQLDLSYNQLTTVVGLGCLASLEELRLASNRLQALPNVSRCSKVLRPHPLPVSVVLTWCSHCTVAGTRCLL